MLRSSGYVFALILGNATIAGAQTPLGVPNTGNAPPAGSPIQIEDCVAGNDGGALLAKSDGRFKIVFTNEGRVPADLIRFRVVFGDESFAIRDSGVFSPGVTITHAYKHRGGNVYSSPLFASAKLGCTVDAVHFKDGSEWTPAAAVASLTHTTELKPIGDGFIWIEMEQTPSGVAARLLLPGGPARTAGMMQGDLLEKIDDQRITNVQDAVTLISSVQPGARLKITVMRDGAERELTVIVGSHPK
jgi:hypothetical protein